MQRCFHNLEEPHTQQYEQPCRIGPSRFPRLLILEEHHLTFPLFRFLAGAVRAQVLARPANQTIHCLTSYLNTLNHLQVHGPGCGGRLSLTAITIRYALTVITLIVTMHQCFGLPAPAPWTNHIGYCIRHPWIKPSSVSGERNIAKEPFILSTQYSCTKGSPFK